MVQKGIFVMQHGVVWCLKPGAFTAIQLPAHIGSWTLLRWQQVVVGCLEPTVGYYTKKHATHEEAAGCGKKERPPRRTLTCTQKKRLQLMLVLVKKKPD